jgi:flagellar hook-associated protein 2
MSATSSAVVSATTASTSTYSISDILSGSSGTNKAIDVSAAVSAGLYADRAPERVWQADQATLSSQTSAINSIQTATEALATDMEDLNSLTGPLAARTVTSSNTNYVTATAATGTATGTHTIVVNSLATTAGWYSGSESSPTATLSTSSFTLTTASGDSVTFQTGSNTTGDNLNDLATAINSATTSSGASLGVKATVMSDSKGSRLAITANASGASNDFSISEPYTSWTAPQMTSSETLAANSITLNLNGTSVTVTTTDGESYADLAKAINKLSANTYTQTDNSTDPPTTTTGTYVTATATTDSSGNTNLSIVSTDGKTTFSINEPSSTDTTFAFTQSAQGADASITVDGVPAQYSSNTVKGAISGVTLSLLGAAPGSQIGLTVASDASAVSTAINQFVTDYNTALGLVNSQFKVSTTTDSSGNTTTSQGVLGSDSTLVSLQGTLERAMSYVATPADGTSTSVSTLRDLGIKVADDGTLSVDSSTLNNALATNPSDVQNFFEGAALNGFANSVYSALNSYTNPANGAFTVDLKGIASTNSSLTSQINDFESSYIASQQTILTAEYTEAETALQGLSTKMAQINALLGLTSSGNNNG